MSTAVKLSESTNTQDLRASGPLPADHPPVAQRRIGVLLVNLGTPDAPTPGAVRRYLAEFLSDTRIVDYPRFFWLPILHGVILNVRPAKTAKAYASIWHQETDESPLRYYTRVLCEKLAGDNANASVIFDWAMRYGNPSVASRINQLKEQGCDRLVIIPMYPQYSSTTTASVNDAVFAALSKMKWQPAIRTAPAFHDDAAYIAALGARIKETLAQSDHTPERFILSFHGLPERLLPEGDPYHCHCAKTARLLREHMGWSEEYAPLTFQSRFGPEKWLGPATDDMINKAARDGVKHIAVITPGFTADCIETLEEIGIEAAHEFKDAGGESFQLIPCLNDSPAMLGVMRGLIDRELAGWCDQPVPMAANKF